MKEPDTRQKLSPPSMKQFREFVRKIVSVPKSEIDKEEAEYQRRRKPLNARKKTMTKTH